MSEDYDDPMLDCPNNNPYSYGLNSGGTNKVRDRDYDTFPDPYEEEWDETIEEADDALEEIWD